MDLFKIALPLISLIPLLMGLRLYIVTCKNFERGNHIRRQVGQLNLIGLGTWAAWNLWLLWPNLPVELIALGGPLYLATLAVMVVVSKGRVNTAHLAKTFWRKPVRLITKEM